MLIDLLHQFRNARESAYRHALEKHDQAKKTVQGLKDIGKRKSPKKTPLQKNAEKNASRVLNSQPASSPPSQSRARTSGIDDKSRNDKQRKSGRYVMSIVNGQSLINDWNFPKITSTRFT